METKSGWTGLDWKLVRRGEKKGKRGRGGSFIATDHPMMMMPLILRPIKVGQLSAT